MTNYSIKVDFSGNIEKDHPKCVHGPTLLYNSATSSFFACSACRDRQECDIVIPYEKRNENKSKKIIEQNSIEYKRFKEHIQALQKNRKNLHKQSKM